MIFCGRVGVLIIIKTTATRTQAGAINSETNGNEMELNSSVAMSAIKRWNPLPVVCGWFIIRIMGADYCATTNSPRNNSNSNQNTEQFRPDCLCVCCCGGASGAVAFFFFSFIDQFFIWYFDRRWAQSADDIRRVNSEILASAAIRPESGILPAWFFFVVFPPYRRWLCQVDWIHCNFLSSVWMFECLNVWMLRIPEESRPCWKMAHFQELFSMEGADSENWPQRPASRANSWKPRG